MDFLTFLKNEGVDFKGRSLSEIWKYTDIQIEQNHDFIQVVFPLNKPSANAFHGFYLSDQSELLKLQNSETVKSNLIKSARWFLGFLERSMSWRKGYDHNQLRITRVIECLRLLVSNEVADTFYKDILLILGTDNSVNQRTLQFWSEA